MSAAGTVLAVAAASAEAAGMPCLIDRLSHPNAKALLEVPRLHLHTPRSEGRTSASLSEKDSCICGTAATALASLSGIHRRMLSLAQPTLETKQMTTRKV